MKLGHFARLLNSLCFSMGNHQNFDKFKVLCMDFDITIRINFFFFFFFLGVDQNQMVWLN